MSNTGKLSVSLDLDSYLLRDGTPIDVRDSHMALLRQVGHNQSVELPEGLYEVSAVLQDGRRHRKFVQVRKQDAVRTTLSAPVEVKGHPPQPAPIPGSNLGDRPAERGILSVDRSASFEVAGAEEEAGVSFAQPSGAPAPARLSLLETDAELLEPHEPFHYRFAPAGNLERVPTATFETPSATIRISLPVNPGFSVEESSCDVRAIERTHGLCLRASVHPQRKVSHAMQAMLASQELGQAAGIADDAKELLFYKYQDPVGAALGATILYRVGRLADHIGWLGNLAQSFKWLPDGAILLAALKLKQGDTTTAVDLLSGIQDKPVMFTDNFSLLVNLVRSMPSEVAGSLAPLRAQLVEDAPYMDWDAVTCTRVVPKESDDA